MPEFSAVSRKQSSALCEDNLYKLLSIIYLQFIYIVIITSFSGCWSSYIESHIVDISFKVLLSLLLPAFGSSSVL